jgi:hypothetical protein
MLRSVIKSTKKTTTTTTTTTTTRLLLLSFHYNSKIRGQEHYDMREIISLLLCNSNNGQFLLLHCRHQSHSMHCLISPPTNPDNDWSTEGKERITAGPKLSAFLRDICIFHNVCPSFYQVWYLDSH